MGRIVSSAVLLACVTSLAFYFPVEGCREPVYEATDGLIGSSQSTSDFYQLYPSEEFSAQGNSQELCEAIASGLGASPVSPFADNDENISDYLWGDDRNASIIAAGDYEYWYYYDCYSWWARGADGIEIGALYNKDHRLVQITIYPSISNSLLWHASSVRDDDLLSKSLEIAESIGVPTEFLANREVRDAGTGTLFSKPVDFYRVTLSGDLCGLDVGGANRVVLSFQDNEVYWVRVFCLFESPSLSIIPESQAIEACIPYLESELSPLLGNISIVSGPKVIGYLFDQDTFALAFAIGCSFEVSADPFGRSAHVVVDAENGEALSFRVYSGMPDYGPIYSSKSTLALYSSTVVLLVLVGVVGALIVVTWPPEFAVLVLTSLMVPLYSRLTEKKPSTLYARGMVHGFIAANQGAHYSEIKRRLPLGNGTLVYHLRILEKDGHIYSRHAGNLVRFYTKDSQRPDTILEHRSEIEAKIVKAVLSNYPCTAAQIRETVGASRQTMHYNLKKLVADGLLETYFLQGRRNYKTAPLLEATAAEGNLPREGEDNS